MTKRSVLVLSDQVPLSASLEAQLSQLDFELQGVAATRVEALAYAQGSPPDLVLVDAALDGDGSGVSFAESIGREGPIPVLFTARALDDRFFHNSIDLLCMLDFDGHFRRLNSAWEQTLGFTREELMSRPFIEFVHPDDRDRTLKQNREVRGGGQALAFENRYLCKDGSFRWFRWNATPDSDVRVIYSVARDVTAQREAEAERERLLTELRGALADVKTLGELLPICSYCRKIRDDEAYWHTVEGYVARHTDTRFTHSICPTCMATEVEPKLTEFEQG